jgi:hypothetical protein|tara:strand:+ start:907 stop:2268 length:1362 start_codon:yes stop_codon:yes gene_type:complete
MKKLLLLLIIPLLSFGQTINDLYSFTEPIIVNNNPELGLNRPRIIVNNEGFPLIMWTSIDDKKIYISKYTEQGFNEPTLITPSDFTFYGSQNYGPEIDNNGDYIAIVLHNTMDKTNNVYIIYSDNGGVTFSDPIKIVEEDDLIEGAGIHINSNNIPILTYEKLPFSGEASQLVGFGEFIEGFPGLTFGDFTIANMLTEGIPCECCLGHLASNDENLVFTYRNNINNIRNMFACSYNNEMQAFNEGFSIDSYNQSLTVCPTEGPKSLLLDDYIVTAFKSYAYSPARISVSISDVLNETLQEEFVVDWAQGYGVQSLPEITQNDNNIAVVWKEFRYYNIDVFISLIGLPFNETEVDLNPSISISSSEPNSQTAEDFTSVDIIGYNDEFHITYLDYNNKTLYYRKYTPNNINNIKESFNNRVKLNTIDILGRETNSKGFHIEIYNDGSVEKKYVIE